MNRFSDNSPQPTIKGTSSLLAIVGDPVAKVKSTDMVNRALFEARLDAVLIPLHVSSTGVGEILQSLKFLLNLKGIVVTMPHKGAVIPFLDEADEPLAKGSERGRLIRMRGDEGGVCGRPSLA